MSTRAVLQDDLYERLARRQAKPAAHRARVIAVLWKVPAHLMAPALAVCAVTARRGLDAVEGAAHEHSNQR